jgi:hypothetical protein
MFSYIVNFVVYFKKCILKYDEKKIIISKVFLSYIFSPHSMHRFDKKDVKNGDVYCSHLFSSDRFICKSWYLLLSTNIYTLRYPYAFTANKVTKVKLNFITMVP